MGEISHENEISSEEIDEIRNSLNRIFARAEDAVFSFLNEEPEEPPILEAPEGFRNELLEPERDANREADNNDGPETPLAREEEAERCENADSRTSRENANDEDNRLIDRAIDKARVISRDKVMVINGDKEDKFADVVVTATNTSEQAAEPEFVAESRPCVAILNAATASVTGVGEKVSEASSGCVEKEETLREPEEGAEHPGNPTVNEEKLEENTFEEEAKRDVCSVGVGVLLVSKKSPEDTKDELKLRTNPTINEPDFRCTEEIFEESKKEQILTPRENSDLLCLKIALNEETKQEDVCSVGVGVLLVSEKSLEDTKDELKLQTNPTINEQDFRCTEEIFEESKKEQKLTPKENSDSECLKIALDEETKQENASNTKFDVWILKKTLEDTKIEVNRRKYPTIHETDFKDHEETEKEQLIPKDSLELLCMKNMVEETKQEVMSNESKQIFKEDEKDHQLTYGEHYDVLCVNQTIEKTIDKMGCLKDKSVVLPPPLINQEQFGNIEENEKEVHAFTFGEDIDVLCEEEVKATTVALPPPLINEEFDEFEQSEDMTEKIILPPPLTNGYKREDCKISLFENIDVIERDSKFPQDPLEKCNEEVTERKFTSSTFPDISIKTNEDMLDQNYIMNFFPTVLRDALQKKPEDLIGENRETTPLPPSFSFTNERSYENFEDLMKQVEDLTDEMINSTIRELGEQNVILNQSRTLNDSVSNAVLTARNLPQLPDKSILDLITLKLNDLKVNDREKGFASSEIIETQDRDNRNYINSRIDCLELSKDNELHFSNIPDMNVSRSEVINDTANNELKVQNLEIVINKQDLILDNEIMKDIAYGNLKFKTDDQKKMEMFDINTNSEFIQTFEQYTIPINTDTDNKYGATYDADIYSQLIGYQHRLDKISEDNTEDELDSFQSTNFSNKKNELSKTNEKQSDKNLIVENLKPVAEDNRVPKIYDLPVIGNNNYSTSLKSQAALEESQNKLDELLKLPRISPKRSKVKNEDSMVVAKLPLTSLQKNTDAISKNDSFKKCFDSIEQTQRSNLDNQKYQGAITDFNVGVQKSVEISQLPLISTQSETDQNISDNNTESKTPQLFEIIHSRINHAITINNLNMQKGAEMAEVVGLENDNSNTSYLDWVGDIKRRDFLKIHSEINNTTSSNNLTKFRESDEISLASNFALVEELIAENRRNSDIYKKEIAQNLPKTDDLSKNYHDWIEETKRPNLAISRNQSSAISNVPLASPETSELSNNYVESTEDAKAAENTRIHSNDIDEFSLTSTPFKKETVQKWTKTDDSSKSYLEWIEETKRPNLVISKNLLTTNVSLLLPETDQTSNYAESTEDTKAAENTRTYADDIDESSLTPFKKETVQKCTKTDDSSKSYLEWIEETKRPNLVNSKNQLTTNVSLSSPETDQTSNYAESTEDTKAAPTPKPFKKETSPTIDATISRLNLDMQKSAEIDLSLQSRGASGGGDRLLVAVGHVDPRPDGEMVADGDACAGRERSIRAEAARARADRRCSRSPAARPEEAAPRLAWSFRNGRLVFEDADEADGPSVLTSRTVNPRAQDAGSRLRALEEKLKVAGITDGKTGNASSDSDSEDLIPSDSEETPRISQFNSNDLQTVIFYDDDIDRETTEFEMRGDNNQQQQLQQQDRKLHNPDRGNLKSLLKKPGRAGAREAKKNHRVVFNETKNEFFDADYIILIREECEYDDEEDDGVCTCNQHEMVRLTCCEPNCNCNGYDGGYDATPQSPKFAPPLEFVDAVTLSPPEEYKDMELEEQQQLIALQREMVRRGQRAAVCRECSASHEDEGEGSLSDNDDVEIPSDDQREADEKEKTDQSQQTTPTTPPSENVPNDEGQRYILDNLAMTTSSERQTMRESEDKPQSPTTPAPNVPPGGSPISGILKGGRLWKQGSNEINTVNSNGGKYHDFQQSDSVTSDDEGPNKRSVRFIDTKENQSSITRDVCDGAPDVSLQEEVPVKHEEGNIKETINQNSESTEMMLTFKLGNHVLISNNSLKPNSAVRQLFPCTKPPGKTEDDSDNNQQYLVTAESLKAFEEAKRSKLPQIIQSGDTDESIRRAIERNTLRRSLIRGDPKNKKSTQKTDNSLVERIKQLTCDVDDDVNVNIAQHRASPPGEEARNSPEAIASKINNHDKSFSPSSSSTTSSNSSSMSSTYKKITDLFSKRDKPDVQNVDSKLHLPAPDLGNGPQEFAQEPALKITTAESRKQFLSTLVPLTACVSGIGLNEEYYHMANSHNGGGGDRTSMASSVGTEYSLEDIDEVLRNDEEENKKIAPDVLAGTPSASESGDELAIFVQQDAGRIERIKKKYQPEAPDEDDEHDDYGFNRRPSVRGIKPRFGSTTEILQQIQNQIQAPPQNNTPPRTQVVWPYYSETNLTPSSDPKRNNPRPVANQNHHPINQNHHPNQNPPPPYPINSYVQYSRPASYVEENPYQNCANQKCAQVNYRNTNVIYPPTVRVRGGNRPLSPPPQEVSKTYHQTMVYIPYNHIEGYHGYYGAKDCYARVTNQNQINKRYIEAYRVNSPQFATSQRSTQTPSTNCYVYPSRYARAANGTVNWNHGEVAYGVYPKPRYPPSADSVSLTDSDSQHSKGSMPGSPTKNPSRFVERGAPEGAASVSPQDGSTMTSPTSPPPKPVFYAMNV